MYYLYTDGGARGNPGPAGAGAVLTDQAGQVLMENKKALGRLTNNEAEYRALLFGLELAKGHLGKTQAKQAKIEVRLDSELVVKQLTGRYQIKEENLIPLFVKVWNQQVKDLPHLNFVHIGRQANRRADELANQAMDEAAAGK